MFSDALSLTLGVFAPARPASSVARVSRTMQRATICSVLGLVWPQIVSMERHDPGLASSNCSVAHHGPGGGTVARANGARGLCLPARGGRGYGERAITREQTGKCSRFDRMREDCSSKLALRIGDQLKSAAKAE
ncbi:MAG TPA: hypothetical protein VF742_09430 [Terracidiphilus sp.]